MITVYTRPGCRPCKRVLAWLRGANLDFEEVDVSADAGAYDYVTKTLSAMSVPVIIEDGQPPIIGYQPDKVIALIRRLTDTERNQ